jgi:hypothetical protein
MSNIFYESTGRVVWGLARRHMRHSVGNNGVRYGAVAAVAVGVIAVGAVLARSHAPAE